MNTAPEVLKNRFGHRQFRSRQAEIVATILAGENALVIMPTGMGKSLCYQVPAIVLAEQARGEEAQSTVTHRNATADSGSGIRQNSSPPVHAKGCLAASTTKAPLTLVISPLIALMKDQVDALIAKGVSAAFVNSSLTRDLREQRYQQIEDGDFDLLYVTPERFRKSEFVTVLAARKIVLLAVDEAHCISEWGHDFRPDYTRVGDIRRELGCPTTIALTATATPEVQTDIARQLGLELLNDEQVNVDREVEAPAETRAETKREFEAPAETTDAPRFRQEPQPPERQEPQPPERQEPQPPERQEAQPPTMRLFHSGIERPNLTLEVAHVWDDDEKSVWIQKTRVELPGSAIVYFTLIRKLLEFSDRLWAENMPHLIYHGELPRQQRRSLQESFMNEDGHLVLATNAFGMGIDKADIRFVLHADLPGSLESYYQEIGRAGRDGLPSKCLLLYDQRDLATQMEFLQWSNPDAEFYSRVYDFLLHETEQVNAFGIEWLRERLHFKQKHDRRLETVLGMLDRWGVIEGTLEPLQINGVTALPDRLRDASLLSEKLKRDQQKLLAMVEYANLESDRMQYLRDYFGLPPVPVQSA